MYNNPSGDVNKISLGPGIVYIGTTGSTPTIDVGYVKGEATLTFERSQTEIRQGSPQTIVDALVNSENVMIEFSGIEWNLDNLLYALGDGATSVSGATDIYKVGGKPVVQKRSLMFFHKMADGSSLFVDLWKAVPEGVITSKVSPTDPHEQAYKWKAMDPGNTDWAGGTLSDGQRLVRVRRIRA